MHRRQFGACHPPLLCFLTSSSYAHLVPCTSVRPTSRHRSSSPFITTGRPQSTPSPHRPPPLRSILPRTATSVSSRPSTYAYPDTPLRVTPQKPRTPPYTPHPYTSPLHHSSQLAAPSQPPSPRRPPTHHNISPRAASPLCFLTSSSYAPPAPCTSTRPHPYTDHLHQSPATTAAVRPIHLYRSCISPARSPFIPTIPTIPPWPHTQPPPFTSGSSSHVHLALPVHLLHKLHNLRCRILADIVHTIEADQKSLFKVDDWSVLQYTVGVKENDERSFL